MRHSAQQTEMLPVVALCVMAEELQKQADEQRWREWGQGKGLLTRDDIARGVHADWEWDDYCI